MIVVELSGGLGNQMFQYTYGVFLSEKLNCGLVIDKNFLEYYPIGSKNTKRYFELKHFHISSGKRLSSGYILSSLLGFKLFYHINRFLYLKRKELTILREEQLNDTDKLKSNYYIIGHFQSYRYFGSVREKLFKEFRFNGKFDKDNASMMGCIEIADSVSLHVRRGDYLRKNNLTKHGVLDVSYYQEAIEYISNRVESPHFFIFSDDLSWVKDNINFKDSNMTFVDINRGSDSFKDLILMRNCKHNIIANSSFSWWGASLNENKGKIVIAPQNWFVKDSGYLDNELIPKEWKRV